jgi:hypothetical protein
MYVSFLFCVQIHLNTCICSYVSFMCLYLNMYFYIEQEYLFIFTVYKHYVQWANKKLAVFLKQFSQNF